MQTPLTPSLCVSWHSHSWLCAFTHLHLAGTIAAVPGKANRPIGVLRAKFAARQPHPSKLRPISGRFRRPQTRRTQPPRANQQSSKNPDSQNQRPPHPAQLPKPPQQSQTRRQKITTNRHFPRRLSASQQTVIKMPTVAPKRRPTPRNTPRHHQQRIQNRQSRNHKREEQRARRASCTSRSDKVQPQKRHAETQHRTP
jgi:hypothetical protein